MRKICETMLFLFAFSVLIVAQVSAQFVNGKVLDERGNPIIGATVIEIGTHNGTVTDAKGFFSLKMNSLKGMLQVRYLGYQPKEVQAVGGNNNLIIKLQEENQSLNEVVVVGYGTEKKISLTGSVSTVKSADILRAPLPTISQALEGQLPGLITQQSSGEPGNDGVTMYIRGIGTTQGASPLVLVDGVERSIDNLDPSEISSVTILKDAASAAVYGVRGANGVILVTTKRGAEGTPTINYSTSYTLSSNTRMPKYLNGEEYVKWWNYADQINGRTPTFSDAVVNKVTNGDPNGIYGNTNWLNLILKSTAPTIHHDITLDGGNENVKYFVSLGYMDQNGIIKGVDFSRYNLMSNLDAKITKEISLSLYLSGFISNKTAPQISNFDANGNSVSCNLMNQILTAAPYLNPQTKDGKYLTSSINPGDNPLAARDQSGFDNANNSGTQSSLTLKYDAPFLKGLSFKVVGSYDRSYTNTKSFYTPFDLYYVNPSSSSENMTLTTSPYGSQSILSEAYYQSNRWTLQEFITYNQTFNKNAFNGLLVAEQSDYNYTYMGASAQNYNLNDLAEFTYANANPNMPTSGTTVLNRAGWVGRLNYTYDNRYIAEVSTRVDGSTNFAPKHRYGVFPSASLAWRVSEEDFFKKWHTAITNLKLRASFGTLGNDQANSSYPYLQSYRFYSSPVAYLGGTTVKGLYPSSLPNENLTWERSRTTNVGFDMELWNGVLGVEFDGFYKLTTNILTSVSSSYPPSVGGYYPSTINSGKVDVRGFELVLNHKNKIGDFSYSMKGNISWARDRILSMDQASGIPSYQSLIGHPIGVAMGFVALGLFKTDGQAASYPVVSSTARAGDIMYKDINGDGKITVDQDATIIGKSSTPELTFGYNFTSSWKNFDFDFLIQGAAICDNELMGNYPGIGWDDTQFTRTFYNNGNSPLYLVKGAWSPSNPNGKYPRLDNTWRPENNYASTLWVINGSYARLKNVQIGYTFPKSITTRLRFEPRIYIAGTNLFTMSAFKYLDPEAPNVTNGYYPQQKTYSIGVSVKF
jgi:TonB-linked SusC/RagA family outer membrane protein